MTIKLTDYVKVEEMKRLLLIQMEQMGLKEQVRTANTKDLNTLVYLMSELSKTLKEVEDEEKKLYTLVNYVITLWAKLIIDYGADYKELL